MASIAVTDARDLQLATAGPVIKRAAWESLQHAHAGLALIEQLRAKIERETAVQRDAAVAAGHAEGRRAGLAELAIELDRINRVNRDLLANGHERVVELALAIVARIAPKLDIGQLLPALVHAAVAEVQAEQVLQVRVAPSAAEAVEADLARLRSDNPQIAAFQIVADDALAARGCVLQSESGRVEAGFDEQLAAIAEALRRTAREAA
jgi:flagellar biosynthesis/type III secretory pathway protein FliH